MMTMFLSRFFKDTEPAPAEFRLGERVLPLTVRENPRATRLTLRIAPGGQSLTVTVPPGTRPGDIERFVARHADWLEERLARLPHRPRLRPGARLPIRGRPHLIVHAPARRGLVTVVESGQGPELHVHGERPHLPRRIADHLKREARRDIPDLAGRHAASIGRSFTSLHFRDTVSRWGSCSSSGALSFSWRIMMAPPAVIDYLVAHEVAHLAEMNHGPRFWALCRQLNPQTDRCRDWLKKNGPALLAISFDDA